VQQQGPTGALGVVDILDKHWRVVLVLGDGSIRNDWQWGAGDRVSANTGVFGLPVPNQKAGNEIAVQLRHAVTLCQEPASP
jgi:hypothetical protein